MTDQAFLTSLKEGDKAIWKYKAGDTICSGSYYGFEKVTILEVLEGHFKIETKSGAKMYVFKREILEGEN